MQTQVPMEDKDGDPKPKLGSGLWGHGPPLTSMLMGKQRAFSDGFGLCSPGRWMPYMRRSASDTPSLGFLEASGTELEKKLQSFCDVRLLAMKLAAGKVNGCPFPRAAVEEGGRRKAGCADTGARSAILFIDRAIDNS